MTALKPCGTRAAYERHKRRGEDACEPCRAANAACHADARRIYGRARTRAMTRMVAAYPEQYRVFYERAKARETQPLDHAAFARATQQARRDLAREYRDVFEPLLSEVRQRIEAGDAS